MDIQHLVDSLEQVLNESTRVPLSAYLIVNEEKVYSLLDQMRVAVPEEIKRANRIEARKTGSWPRPRRRPSASVSWRGRKRANW
jgi:hypothetical protein